MTKKTIKFKGIEFEEVSRDEYYDDLYADCGVFMIGNENYYLAAKKKTKKQVVQE